MGWRVAAASVAGACVLAAALAGAAGAEAPGATPRLAAAEQREAPPSPPPAEGFPVPVGGRFRDCARCPELVVLPPGRFRMGSPPEEQGREEAEGPQRDMLLRAPLALGRFEVTFDEWDSCAAAATPPRCRPLRDALGEGGGRRPVTGVRWDDVGTYLAWLGRESGGQRYRLPSEAEWEFAARAGTRTAYAFGETIRSDQANFDAFAPPRRGSARALPVGSFPPNAWGLHDMHGNVWEWVQDCYAPQAGASVAGDGDCAARVTRGGSWASTAAGVRAARRIPATPDFFAIDLGFRVLRLPEGGAVP